MLERAGLSKVSQLTKRLGSLPQNSRRRGCGVFECLVVAMMNEKVNIGECLGSAELAEAPSWREEIRYDDTSAGNAEVARGEKPTCGKVCTHMEVGSKKGKRMMMNRLNLAEIR